jgi:hypothetical protein
MTDRKKIYILYNSDCKISKEDTILETYSSILDQAYFTMLYHAEIIYRHVI